MKQRARYDFRQPSFPWSSRDQYEDSLFDELSDTTDRDSSESGTLESSSESSEEESKGNRDRRRCVGEGLRLGSSNRMPETPVDREYLYANGRAHVDGCRE